MFVDGRGHLPGHLVVVSGPSGSGKSTVLKRTLGHSGFGLRYSVSATTRPPRPGEVEGADYFFLSRDEFETDVARGEFLEWAEYNGNLYGTPTRPVFDALASGTSVVLEIEVKGAVQIRHRAPGAYFVFIRTATFAELESRLLNRGTESDQAVFRRLQRGREELAEAHWYDVQLVNDDLDRCVGELAAVLTSLGCGG